MRRLLLCVLLIACSDGPTEPQSRVRFAVDGATCQGSGTLIMFIDGIEVGRETLSAGEASEWHPVTPGFHDLAARMQDGSFEWPRDREFVPETGLTHNLQCLP